MSIINKALKELDNRGGTDYSMHGKYVPPAKHTNNLIVYLLSAACVIAAIVLCFVIYIRFWHSNETQTVVKNETVASIPNHESKNDKNTADLKAVISQTDISTGLQINGKNEETIKNESTKDIQQDKKIITEDKKEIIAADKSSVNPVPKVSGNIKTDKTVLSGSNVKSGDSSSESVPSSPKETPVLSETRREPDVNKSVNKSVQSSSYDEDFYADEGNYVIEDDNSSVNQTVEPIHSSMKIKKTSLSPEKEVELYRKEALNSIARGDSKSATESLEALLEKNPGDTDARARLASLYYGMDKTLDAIKVLDKGLSINPEYYDFRLYLARIYVSSGQTDHAVKILNMASPSVVGNVDYYATLAQFARQSGDYDIAVKAYRKLTSVSGSDGKWYLGLGICLDQNGKEIEALQAYRAATARYLSASSRSFVANRISVLEAKNK